MFNHSTEAQTPHNDLILLQGLVNLSKRAGVASEPQLVAETMHSTTGSNFRRSSSAIEACDGQRAPPFIAG
jgi:hypothetical protein